VRDVRVTLQDVHHPRRHENGQRLAGYVGQPEVIQTGSGQSVPGSRLVSTDRSKLLGSAGDNSVGSRKYGYPGFRRLDSWGLRLNHDRDALADMSCRHKNVILIVTNGGKESA
jgi:hypothetical protein